MRVAILHIPEAAEAEAHLDELARVARAAGWDLRIAPDPSAAAAALTESDIDGGRVSEPVNGATATRRPALRTTELLEREHAARTEAAAARRRAELIVSAGEILASGTDVEAALRAIAERAVTDFADCCHIDLVSDTGETRRLIGAAHAAAAGRATDRLVDALPPVERSPALSDAVSSGRVTFLPAIPEELLSVLADDPLAAAGLRSAGIVSALVVPMSAGGRVLGAMSLSSATPERRFCVDDLSMAEDIARRGALALERSRLAELHRDQGQLLQVMLSSIGDAVVAADVDGVVTFLNDVAEAWLGWPHGDAIGRPIDEVLEIRRVGSDEALESPVVRVQRFGALVNSEPDMVLMTRDGSAIPVEESATPLVAASGAPNGAVMVYRDATERRRIEQELVKLGQDLAFSRDRLEGITASVPGVVWEWWREPDDDGRVDFVSDGITDLLGIPADGYRLNDAINEVVHPEDAAAVRGTISTMLDGEPGGDFECRMIARDGHVIRTVSYCVVVRDSDGRAQGLRGVTLDVSDRRRAEEEMARAREEAEAANRSKDQFLAVLSHELRTPLTPVLAVTAVLENDERITPDQRPLIEMIRRNIELETRLIDDLLDLTRIAKGKLALNMETVDVHELASATLNLCRPELQGRRLTMTLDLKARDHFVRADPTRLQQVFWNLIKNGVKFTPEGGRIVLRTLNDRPGRLTIEIADSGMGIEPHILPRIFSAFDQGDLEVTRQFGGLGLGLSISHSLIQMHGGSLTARSDGRNLGSVFTMTLDTVVRLREPGLRPTDGGIRVLIVDDHVETGKVMKLLLERRGYQVDAAHSVKEAVRATEERRYDLVISDIGLGDGSGLDLMRILAPRGIRGIALSGFGMEEDIAASREAGFSEHLIKPVSFQTLQETIVRVLSTGQLTESPTAS